MLASVGSSARVQAKDGTVEDGGQKRDCQEKREPSNKPNMRFRQLG